MAGTIDVNVAFTATADSFKATVAQLNTGINSLRATVDSLNKTVAGLGKGFNASLASSSKATEAVVSGQVKIKTAITGSTRELMTQSTMLDSIYNKNSKVMQSRYLSSPKSLNLGLQRLQGEMGSVLTKDASGSLSFLGSAGNEMAQLAVKTDMVSRTVDNMATKWTDAAKNAQWTGRQMSMGITAPILGIGAAAVDMAYQYDQADLRLRKFLTHGNDFNTMKQQLEGLSTTTGSTYQDLAGVAGEFEGIFGGAPGGTKAVQDLTQLTAQANLLGQVGDLPGVQNLVRMLTSGVYQQQGNSLADSVKMTSQAMQFFNEVESHAHIDMKELVNDFPQLIGVMNQFNIGVPQATALLSSFKAAGIDTSQGASALVAGLARITAAMAQMDDPGLSTAGSRLKQLKGAITDVNKTLPQNKQLNFFDVKGNLLPAPQTMLQLANAWSSMGKLQQSNFAYTAFGSTRYAAMIPLLDQMSQALGQQNMTQQQINGFASDYVKIMNIGATNQQQLAKGQATDMNKIWNDQLKALENSPAIKMKDALNTLKNLGASIGDQLLPMFIMFLDKINQIVSWIAQLSPHTKRLIVEFALAAAAIGPLVYALAQANLLASTLVKTFITKPFKFFGQMRVRQAEPFANETNFRDELFQSKEKLLQSSKAYALNPSEENKRNREIYQQDYVSKIREQEIGIIEQQTIAIEENTKALREPKKINDTRQQTIPASSTPGKATEVVDINGHDPAMEKAIERQQYREIPSRQAKLTSAIPITSSSPLKDIKQQVKGEEEQKIFNQHTISPPIPLEQQLKEANKIISDEANLKLKEINEYHSQYEDQAKQAIDKHNTLLEPYKPEITPNPNQTPKQFLDYALASMKKSDGPLAPYTAATHSELATTYMGTAGAQKFYKKVESEIPKAMEDAKAAHEAALAAATTDKERAEANVKLTKEIDKITNVEAEVRRMILNDFDRGLSAEKRIGAVRTNKEGQLIEGPFSRQLGQQYEHMGLTPRPTTATKEELKMFAESSPLEASNMMKQGILPKSIMDVLGAGVFGKTGVESMVSALERQYETAGGEKIITHKDPDENQQRILDKLRRENENSQAAIDTHQNAIVEQEAARKTVSTQKNKATNPERIKELDAQLEEHNKNISQLNYSITGYEGVIKHNDEEIERIRKNFAITSKSGPNFISNVRKLSDSILRMVSPEAAKSSIHSERLQEGSSKGTTPYAPQIMDVGMAEKSEDFAIPRSELPPKPSNLREAKAFLGDNNSIARDILNIPQDFKVPTTIPQHNQLKVLLGILGQDGLPPQLEEKIIEMAQKKYEVMIKDIESIHEGANPNDQTLIKNKKEWSDKIDAVNRQKLEISNAEAARIKAEYEQDRALYDEHIAKVFKENTTEQSILNHYYTQNESMKSFVENEIKLRKEQLVHEASFDGKIDALHSQIIEAYDEWFRTSREQAALAEEQVKRSPFEQAIQELGGNRGAARTIAGVKPGELVPPTGTTEATKFATTMRALSGGQPSEELQQQILSLAGISRLAGMSKSTPKAQQNYAGVIEQLITDHLNGGAVKSEPGKLEEARKQIAGTTTHTSMLNKITSNIRGGHAGRIVGNKINKWTAPVESAGKSGILNKAMGFTMAPMQPFLHPIKFTVDALGLRKDAEKAGVDAAKAAERGAAGKVLHIGKQVLLGAGKLAVAPITSPVKALLGGGKAEAAKAGEGVAKDVEKAAENHAKSSGGIIKTLLKNMGGPLKLPAMQLGPEAASMATTFLPLLPILAVVGGLIALIVIHWKDFSKEASGALKAVKTAFGDLIKTVITPFKQVFADLGFGAKKGSDSISGMGTTIKSVLNLVADGLKLLTKFLAPVFSFIATAFGFIASVVKTVIDLITGNWKALGEDLKKIAKFFVEGILTILLYIPTQFIAIVDTILKAAEKLPFIGKHIKGIATEVDKLHTSMVKIPSAIGNMIDKSVPAAPSNKTKSAANNMGQQIGDTMGQGITNGLGNTDLTAPIGDSASNAGNQAAKDFVSEFQNQIGKVTGDWKTAALAVFDNYAKAQTQSIDTQIKNLDDLTKAQDEQFNDEKKNMTEAKAAKDAQAQDAAYAMDSQVALSQGNFSDYMHLQLTHITDVQNRNDQAASDALDAKKQAYDDQKAQDKQALQDKKQNLTDQLAAQKQNLQEQLDTITQFAPKNAAAASAMQVQILAALNSYTGGYATTAVTQQKAWNENWQTAVQNTQKALDDKTYWSGQDAASQFGLALQGNPESPGNLSGINADTSGGAAGSAGSAGSGDGSAVIDGITYTPNPTGGYNVTSTYFGGPQQDSFFSTLPNAKSRAPSTTRHSGGAIGNLAQGPSDVPATLQTGEYVIQRKAAATLGLDKLHQLNQAHNIPTFHSGGAVMQNLWQNASQKIMTNMVGSWKGGGQPKKIAGYTAQEAQQLQQGAFGVSDLTGSDTLQQLPTYAQQIITAVKAGMLQIIEFVMGNLPGVVLTSTTSGVHANGSYHYKGQAADFDYGGNHSADDKVFKLLEPLASSGKLAELFFTPEGYSWKNGAKTSPIDASQHYNHVHAAIADAFANGLSIASMDAIQPGQVVGSGPNANQKLGQQMAAEAGWTGIEWADLFKLWMQESSWRADATNASSGAYGIPQSLPANKMASAGADWRTNPATQILWGLRYIKERYGDPVGAWAHEVKFNNYHTGGLAELSKFSKGGLTLSEGPAYLHAKETVLSQPLSDKLQNFISNLPNANGVAQGTPSVSVMVNLGNYLGSGAELKALAAKFEEDIIPKIQRAYGKQFSTVVGYNS